MAQQKLFGEAIARDLAKVKASLAAHEAVCIERSKSGEKSLNFLTNRLKRVEAVIVTSAGATIILLATLVLRA